MDRIESFHLQKLIHRDVKPGNFAMGKGSNSSSLYILDYGLAKRYIHLKTGQHISYNQSTQLVGSARYASIHTHMGVEPARRDDLESLAYTLIFLKKGHLPWQGILTECKKENFDKIMEVKSTTSTEEICRGLPVQFAHFLHHCKALEFAETPNYKLLQKLLKDCFLIHNCSKGFDYDWNLLKLDLSEYKNVSPKIR